MPAARIQLKINSAAARCWFVRKTRVRFSGFSEIAASSSMRRTISSPRPDFPALMLLIVSRLRHFEANLLRAFPQHGLSQRWQIFQSRGQGDEMVSSKLSHLGREVHSAIGQQDFGLADAAGIKNDLAGRGIAGVVFVGDAEVEIAKRHPDPLAAPANMDHLALERHRLFESCASLGS